jgi:hypothetical protein
MKNLVEEYRREAAQLRQLALDPSEAWARDLLEGVAQVCDSQAERAARTTPRTHVLLPQRAALIRETPACGPGSDEQIVEPSPSCLRSSGYRRRVTGGNLDFFYPIGFVQLAEHDTVFAIALDPSHGEAVTFGVAAEAHSNRVADRYFGRQLDMVIEMAGPVNPARTHCQITLFACRDRIDLIGTGRRSGDRGDQESERGGG